MIKKSPSLSCQSGSTLLLTALILPLLIMAMGLTIDMARILVVQTKAQSASDAALLGAAATQATEPDISLEFNKLFYANFPANYMNSSISPITVTNISGVFTSRLSVTVPTFIMGYFGSNASTVHILSQVTSGIAPGQALEITFVIDSYGGLDTALALSNSIGYTLQIDEMKLDALALIQSLTVNGKLPPYVHISVVPFDIVVNVGTGHDNWVQTTQPTCPPTPSNTSAPNYWAIQQCNTLTWMSDLTKYQLLANNQNLIRAPYAYEAFDYLSNRKSDYPAGFFYNDNFNDVTDTPPTNGEEFRFRIPNANFYADPTNPSVASWPFTTFYNYGPSYPIGRDSTICNFWDGQVTSGFTLPPPPPGTWPPLPGSAPSGSSLHFDCLDYTPSVSAMVFASNDMSDATGFPFILGLSQGGTIGEAPNEQMEGLTNGKVVRSTDGHTRVNVGLMWGWFTLSSKWQGVWDPNKPNLPLAPNGNFKKILVLMGNNVNSAYTGLTYLGVTMSNDDNTTKSLCDAIKASSDNITIYTVSPTTANGPTSPSTPTNNPLLAYCASQPGYYIHTTSVQDTKTAILGIANSILYDTIRLSQ